jgi:small subunit ribosomal protein S11
MEEQIITTTEETSEAPKKIESKPKKGRKKKAFKDIYEGIAFIHATYNNTIVTLTDSNGNVLGWSSAGHVGFKGPKKATPYAASKIVKDVIDKTKETGLKAVSVFVKGVGAGRDSAIRALNANGLIINSIKDTTPIPHNGCKRPRQRRI